MTKAKKTKPVSPKKMTDLDELTADLQRLQADFINYRRRTDEDRIRAIEVGKEQVIVELFPVLDNIERALCHEPEDIKDHQWVRGIAAMARQLDAQLESIGLRKIGQVGEVFDPNIHEAISADEGNGNSEVVTEVVQNGYQFGDTVIRPAKVKVTSK